MSEEASNDMAAHLRAMPKRCRLLGFSITNAVLSQPKPTGQLMFTDLLLWFLTQTSIPWNSTVLLLRSAVSIHVQEIGNGIICS
jgi:hypothetical protein